MARNDPQDPTKAWPQQPGTREAIEGNADVELATVPRAARQSGEVVFLEHLFNPSAVREMLKLNEYQVVLVSPNGQDSRGSGLELFPRHWQQPFCLSVGRIWWREFLSWFASPTDRLMTQSVNSGISASTSSRWK